ncbi:putative rRNA methylase [Paenibacillus cellulosilyticus]|uniref:Putative rRNA methylase n=1 Tax=Paenibacillus cellulosilyticus TaxID=375489 RepID=A0A2V2YYP9_9BACL|nr:class I SAM-dependent methyltransferase [Paenibacillus cellulosilyticus]PWW07484.1 putative rRNA methylase [Paenibacillus cellulosilyticus]QKS44361.1 class I SAM-dependent methyltransferase [Paenibacillus cellulosilyticus]
MGFLSVLSMAHQMIRERVHPGDIVIDATAGNGVDTRFLAELVGPRGVAYAFDIQEAAITATRKRLEPLEEQLLLPDLRLVYDSHEAMTRHVEADHAGNVAAAMFNLGYLPGADPSVITKTDSSIAALEAAVSLMKPGGIITCVLYPGHPGGGDEAEAVLQWAQALPSAEGQAVLYRMAQKPTAPFLVAIERSRKQ